MISHCSTLNTQHHGDQYEREQWLCVAPPSYSLPSIIGVKDSNISHYLYQNYNREDIISLDVKYRQIYCLHKIIFIQVNWAWRLSQATSILFCLKETLNLLLAVASAKDLNLLFLTLDCSDPFSSGCLPCQLSMRNHSNYIWWNFHHCWYF